MQAVPPRDPGLHPLPGRVLRRPHRVLRPRVRPPGPGREAPLRPRVQPRGGAQGEGREDGGGERGAEGAGEIDNTYLGKMIFICWKLMY